MRLWHPELLPKLPRQQLLGQWREAIALLGNGFGRKHKTVDYVFRYPDVYLIQYSFKVAQEMIDRGYKPQVTKIFHALSKRHDSRVIYSMMRYSRQCQFKYQEHNDSYLQECIENLKRKGVEITL